MKPTLHTGADSQPTRAAVYVRVSTDRQAEEGYSLPEQERRAVEHIGRLGWEHAGTYREAGVSGGKEDRPALGRLLRDLSGVQAVVVSSLDRLGRSTKHLLELYDLFERKGVAFVSLRESIDTSTPVGRLLRTVLSAVAEFERDLGRERTSSGIGSRARTAGKPWGEPKFGYQKGEDGHWQPDPAESEIYGRIFCERVENGLSYNAIATKLNREGVATRRSGGNWTATTIKNLIASRHALGEFQHRGEWHRGQHPPIIDNAVWEAAQRLSVQGAKFAPSRPGRRPARHLFINGSLRCGICGEAMITRTDTDSYMCRGRKQLGTDCPMPALKRAAVDASALRIFERVGLDVDATRQRLADEISQRLRAAETQAGQADREVVAMAAQIARVERDYLSGELSAATYERLSASLAEGQQAADAERDRLVAHVEAFRATAADLDAEHEALRRLAQLRAAVASEIRTAAASHDLEALRGAIGRVFASTEIIWDAEYAARNGGEETDDGHPLTEVHEWQEHRDSNSIGAYPGLYVQPYLRSDVIEGYDDDLRAIVRPVALPLEPGTNMRTSGVPE